MRSIQSSAALVMLLAGLVLGATFKPVPLQAASAAKASVEPMVPLKKTEGWRLTFAEDFQGTRLNLDRWTTCYWWNKKGCTNLGNNELQWYLPANVKVANGRLRLQARKETVSGHEGRPFNYTSGMVTTGRDYDELPKPSRAKFRYGHFEVRAKAPAGKGLWSAVWLLPEDRESRPEIDVMEILGDTPNKLRMHFHYRDEKDERQSLGETATTVDLTADWHVYGLRWEPGTIIWYLDGVEKWRFADARLVPTGEMYLLMNLAVGGDWPGAPDKATRFPADYLIDYVRVWQRDY